LNTFAAKERGPPNAWVMHPNKSRVMSAVTPQLEILGTIINQCASLGIIINSISEDKQLTLSMMVIIWLLYGYGYYMII
jgi:hypothetical protein